MMANPESQGNDEALERRRVLYLLGEAVEKLVRLQNVLARQKVFVEAGRREAEYASVIDPLLKAVKEQSERLTINSARVASFLRKAAPDEAQRTALAAIIQRVIDVVL